MNSLLDRGIAIVIMLFILSMISERFITFVKLYFVKGKGLWLLISKEDDLSIRVKSVEDEKVREMKILRVNIFLSILIALFANANFFHILKNNPPYLGIGWNFPITLDSSNIWLLLGNICQDLLGCVLTGFFISLGSKFWHDLLGLLLEAKNYKRVMTDSETYKIDKVESLDKLMSTYQSDFIKAAYFQAKSKYMAMDNVKAISLKRDDEGYFFELTVKKTDPSLGQYHQYLLDDGTPQSIRLKIVVLKAGDDIVAHSVDLSSKIFNESQPDDWGTLGCLVKPVDENAKERYILTCCHNLVDPVSNLPHTNLPALRPSTDENSLNPIGTVIKAVRDHEIDAALVAVDPSKINDIENFIPTLGIPLKPRILCSEDRGVAKAYMFGAKSKQKKGIVTSLHCDIKIKYTSTDEFQILNLIEIIDNGNAIAQGGDSGSCILDENKNVIGLVVAGSSSATYVIPISTILSKLNVQLI